MSIIGRIGKQIYVTCPICQTAYESYSTENVCPKCTVTFSTPIRIQITRYSTLVAEVIVEPWMRDKTWAAYANMKYKKGLPIGGASMQRADLPRMWNVPVGSLIVEK